MVDNQKVLLQIEDTIMHWQYFQFRSTRQLCTSFDPFERNGAILWLFSMNSLMHLKNIVEFCIVFGAAQLENVIGVVNLPPGTRTFQPHLADKFVGTLNSSAAQRITAPA